MRLKDVERILFENAKLKITPSKRRRLEESYAFLKEFSRDKVIYGINTGFGPMAQYRVSDGDLQALQYNIIRSHSTGAGEPFDPVCVKAAMLARYLTFAQGKSGVHIDSMELLAEFINRDITPNGQTSLHLPQPVQSFLSMT